MKPHTDTNGHSKSTPPGRKTGCDRAATLKAVVGILAGLAIQYGGLWTHAQDLPPFSTYWWLIVLAGTALFVWGCSTLAKSKGYSRVWGLLGVASCFGLIMLASFPRVKETAPSSPEHSLGILQRNAVLGIGLGMVAVSLAYLAVMAAIWKRGIHNVEYDLVVVTCYVLSLWGSVCLAWRKGYAWPWALPSILTIPGWLLLVFLPDRHRSQYKQLHRSLAKFQRLMSVGLAFCGLLVFYVPYIMGYIGSGSPTCDRAAQADAVKLAEALKRVSQDCVNNDCGAKAVPPDFLEYLVGPFYNWEGTTSKCQVLIRIEDNIIFACSRKGSRPNRDEQRYIHRVNLRSGEQLSPVIGPCTGKSYGGPCAQCYEESILGSDCKLRKPPGRTCKEVEMVRSWKRPK